MQAVRLFHLEFEVHRVGLCSGQDFLNPFHLILDAGEVEAHICLGSDRLAHGVAVARGYGDGRAGRKGSRGDVVVGDDVVRRRQRGVVDGSRKGSDREVDVGLSVFDEIIESGGVGLDVVAGFEQVGKHDFFGRAHLELQALRAESHSEVDVFAHVVAVVHAGGETQHTHQSKKCPD